MRKSGLCFFAIIPFISVLANATPAIHLDHKKPLMTVKKAINESYEILDLTNLIANGNFVIATKNPQTGTITFTNNGHFVKRDGYFYQGNNRLEGYPIPSNLVTDGCFYDDVKTPDKELPAQATTSVTEFLNLDAREAAPQVEFNKNNSASFNYVSSGVVYDAQGKTFPLSLYFVKKDANIWNVHVLINDEQNTVGQLTFDSNGQGISSGLDNLSLSFNNQKQTISIDLSNCTSFAALSSSHLRAQNGYSVGYIVSESVDQDGYLTAYYSNSQERTFGKVAVFKK